MNTQLVYEGLILKKKRHVPHHGRICELVLISSFDQFLENYRGIKLGFSCTDKT